MAKKKASGKQTEPKQTGLGYSDEENMPEEVTEQADRYRTAMREFNDAKNERDKQKSLLIEAMHKHDITKVRTADGKRLILQESEKIVVETIKDQEE